MILEKIKKIEQFTDAERQILQYLLEHPEGILGLSVRDLAKNSYTSSSTVNRLAGKLSDGKGFTQFKARLFSELHQHGVRPAGNTDEITTDETVYSLVSKVAAAQTEAICRTHQSLDHAAVLRAARMLQQAGQICFFGFDDNLSIARPHLNRMMAYGKQIVLHDATNAQYYQALTIPEHSDTAALILSRTGENRKLVEIASILHDKKIPILLLTSSGESSLGKLATEWIEIQHSLSFETIGSMISDTSVQFILTVLCSLMFSDNYEKSRTVLRQYGQIYMQNNTSPPDGLMQKLYSNPSDLLPQ